MIKRKTKICEQCGKEKFIFGKNRCQRCYVAYSFERRKSLDDKTRCNKIKKTSVKKRVPTGEAQIFREIASERDHVCFVCGIGLLGLAPINFAHVIAKGKFPRARLDKNNISLLCADHHYQYDFKPRSEIIDKPMWQPLLKLESELKLKYNGNTI